jgi:hydrogenase maturation factor HypE
MANTFINKGAAVTNAGADVYGPVAVGKVAIIHSCIISNIHATDSADINIKATVQDGATYYHVAKNVPVPAGSSLVIDKPVDLMAGDEIHMSASADSKLEAILGILEID